MEKCVKCGAELNNSGPIIHVSFKKGYLSDNPFETMTLCEACAYGLLAEIYRKEKCTGNAK